MMMMMIMISIILHLTTIQILMLFFGQCHFFALSTVHLGQSTAGFELSAPILSTFSFMMVLTLLFLFSSYVVFKSMLECLNILTKAQQSFRAVVAKSGSSRASIQPVLYVALRENTWIKWSAHHQAFQKPDNDPDILNQVCWRSETYKTLWIGSLGDPTWAPWL